MELRDLTTEQIDNIDIANLGQGDLDTLERIYGLRTFRVETVEYVEAVNVSHALEQCAKGNGNLERYEAIPVGDRVRVERNPDA